MKLLLIVLAMTVLTVSHAETSMLTLKVELPDRELSNWLNRAVPAVFTGKGEQSICKRVLGVKLCGDARWQYEVKRTGPVAFHKASNRASGLRLGLPLAVRGDVGVHGDTGRLLGLDSVPVSAALTLLLDLGVDSTTGGCPSLTIDLIPRWAEKPTATLPGNIGISFTEILESELESQVRSIQQAIHRSIDCAALLAHIEPLWSACYLQASDKQLGPGTVRIDVHRIHWSLQTALVDENNALLIGIESDLTLDSGLSQAELNKRLEVASCERRLNQMNVPFSPGGAGGKPLATDSSRLVVDQGLSPETNQRLQLNLGHAALATYARSALSDLGPGSDERLKELTVHSVEMQTLNVDNRNALSLAAGFSAVVQTQSGISGWLQRLVGLDEETLEGVLQIQARPRWDSSDETLHLEALTATITRLEPGSGFSLTHAVMALIERQVQMALIEHSSLDMSETLMRLSVKLNRSIDEMVQSRLSAYGAIWQTDTARVRAEGIATAGDGLSLAARVNANWVIRLTSAHWPAEY